MYTHTHTHTQTHLNTHQHRETVLICHKEKELPGSQVWGRQAIQASSGLGGGKDAGEWVDSSGFHPASWYQSVMPGWLNYEEGHNSLRFLRDPCRLLFSGSLRKSRAGHLPKWTTAPGGKACLAQHKRVKNESKSLKRAVPVLSFV